MRQGSSTRKLAVASALCGLTLVLPCAAQSPIGTVVAGDASVQGSVMVVSGGTAVLSGSSVTAGNQSAGLKLRRGGEVLVCPHSRLSLTNSQAGRDLVFGMSTGAIETHYTMGTAADTILTPDFRILLAGPGAFHFAIGADARGNTCIRSLEGNTSSIVVSELMGDGVFQVRPGEQAYFRGGNINSRSRDIPPDCGCPAPVPVMMAETEPAPADVPPLARTTALPLPEVQAPPPAKPDEAEAPAAKPIELPSNSPEALIAKLGSPSAQPVPAPPSDGEIHVMVDAPFVYRGGEDDVPPPPTVVRLSLAPRAPLLASMRVVPPPERAKELASSGHSTNMAVSSKPERKGFFGRVRSFFAAIFK